MDLFKKAKNVVENKILEMVRDGKKEIKVGKMVLVEEGTKEKSEHVAKGATMISVHEHSGRTFILFSS